MTEPNYIIIEDLKLLIAIDENIYGIEDFEENALDNIIDSDQDDLTDIEGAKIDDLTIKEIGIIASACELVNNLAGLQADKLLLYWLRNKDIDFEISDNVDIEDYERNGYLIIRKYMEDD